VEAFALIPLMLLLGLVALRRPIIEGAIAFFLATLLLAVYAWQMSVGAVNAALIKGGFIAFDLTLIVTGALLFMSLLTRSGLLTSLTGHLARISPDMRVQTITLAWLFSGFIEGVAGFGTPAAIVAPILIGLGYTPLGAIAIALVGNSAAVAFGALGTPITIGLGGADVAATIGVMNLIALLVPVMLLVLIAREGKGAITPAIPFALYAGAAFLVPAMIASRFGPAYPSLIGAGAGLVLVVIAARFGWFMPRDAERSKRMSVPDHPLLVSIAPYFVLVSVLIVQRFVPAFMIEIFGVSHALPLANPGLAFFIASLVLANRASPHASDVVAAAKPVLLILLIASAVQVMIRSVENLIGAASMTESFANLLSALPLAITAPMLGALGAFFAGSATVSNLLFAPVHIAAGGGLVALASQTLGAAYANMLSLQNIVAVQATVRAEGLERRILAITALPAAILIFLLVVIGPLLASLV
jgi:lactate permease